MLIERVKSRYRDCAAYRDRGTVESSETGGSVLGSFETNFRRHERVYLSFRFAETDGSAAYGFRVEGEGEGDGDGDNEVLTAFEAPAPFLAKLPAPTSLADAVAIFAGVTFGAAHLIPRLLLPERFTTFSEVLIGRLWHRASRRWDR